MENNNYVSVGNIIEQERLKRQAQIAKGVSSDVYDHIEKAHQDDLSKGVEMTDNLSRFADDVDNLNKAETEFLLSKLQRQIVADPESSLLKSFKSIAINHLNDLEKAHQDGEMHPNGKWVWVSSANGGKGDWRTANGRAHKKHQETHGSRGGKDDENNSMVNSDGYENKSHPKIKRMEELNSKMYDTGLSDDEYSEYNKLREELRQQKLKNKNFMKRHKTIDNQASRASTDALKHAAADENAKPEVRETAKKELEKRNDSAKQKKNDKASSSTVAGGKVDITKIPNAEFKRITQMLEKKNPDHRDAPRHLEEEAMSDKELKNFYAVAEHFKNSSKINKLTQEYCRKWAELARQELQSRKKNR